jgi:hypothetical protein
MGASETLGILDASSRVSQVHLRQELSAQGGEMQWEKIRGKALLYNARVETGSSASFDFRG